MSGDITGRFWAGNYSRQVLTTSLPMFVRYSNPMPPWLCCFSTTKAMRISVGSRCSLMSAAILRHRRRRADRMQSRLVLAKVAVEFWNTPLHQLVQERVYKESLITLILFPANLVRISSGMLRAHSCFGRVHRPRARIPLPQPSPTG